MSIDASAPTVAAIASAERVYRIDGRPRPNASGPDSRASEAAATSTPANGVDPGAAVDAFNKILEPVGVSLKFSRHNDTGAIVIEVLDPTSGEKLRQIPDEAILRLASELDKLQGRIFNRTA